MLLRPAGVAVGAWGWFPLLAGVAVARAVAAVAELEVRLKWPNDVLVGDRKLAGILAERVDDALVLGVGLNVSLRAEERPVPSATSLALEESAVVDRTPVLLALLREMGKRYDGFVRSSGDPEVSGLRTAYRELCSTLGRQVEVSRPGGRSVAGLAVEVDASGRLVVETSHGTEPVGAGDVVHVH